MEESNDDTILDSFHDEHSAMDLGGLDTAEYASASGKTTKGTKRSAADAELNDPDPPKPSGPTKALALPYSSLQTGLVYDVRMRQHIEPQASESDIHPEDPRRTFAIYEALRAAGLLYDISKGAVNVESDHWLGRIDAREVLEQEVCLVHTKEHYDWVNSVADMTDEERSAAVQYEGQDKLDSIYMCANTPFAASLSAGGAIEACRAVLNGRCKNAFALIRPPGHHAEREDVKGFCFFDNVSIATKVCMAEFPETCQRVMIVDWDVHHGNGIQQAHYDNPDVLYVSLHVSKNNTFYPEASYRDGRVAYGDHLHCGERDGLGKNVNVPWSDTGVGDAEYLHAFDQVIMPIGREFDPDLVIIAAGFDAAEGDMLGGCHVTPPAYAQMTHQLMSLADGKLVVCLEGGYNLKSISDSSVAVTQTLMGEAPRRVATGSPSIMGLQDIQKVVREQSKHWNCLHPKPTTSLIKGPVMRIHDIIRQWQADKLLREQLMTPVYIARRDNNSVSYQNQVLATKNYLECKPMLVILHEPPEIRATSDGITGKVDLHNVFMSDPIEDYIQTAICNGFSVIDINIPSFKTPTDDDHQPEARDAPDDQSTDITQLLKYVFAFYIDTSRATHLYLMGTEAGHTAITRYMKDHESTVIDRVYRSIHFIKHVSMQMVRSNTNDRLSSYYHARSMVFVAAAHTFWTTKLAVDPKKKWGNLIRSHNRSLSDMLVQHKDEIFEVLLADTDEWRRASMKLVMDRLSDQADALPERTLQGAVPDAVPAVSNFIPVGSARLPPLHNFGSARNA